MPFPRKPDQVPKNYPPVPVRYPLALFRLQLDAAKRYLFEGEIKDILTSAMIPLDVLTLASDPVLNVSQIACFMQELREVIGSEKAVQFGHEAFTRSATALSRLALPSVPRSVSSEDKLFLRVREAMAGLNRQCGSNLIVKWHGGAEADIFEDTGQHCYGFVAKEVVCQTMTGYLQESIQVLAGVRMNLLESECMVTGSLACRWHCTLA